MAERLDSVVLGSQLVTRGTNIILSWDVEERSGENFEVINGTVDIYKVDGIITAVSGKDLTVGLSRGGVQPVQVLIDASETSNLSVGQHYALINCTLADGQTRIVQAPLRVRDIY